MDKSEPWNFSWIIKNELCASAWPQSRENIAFLEYVGVKHIVTLSQDMQPPKPLPGSTSIMKYHLIPVEEFEPPTLEQIDKFMTICDSAREKAEPVCVHCRMGRGRTGVMLACYLVKYYKQIPAQAITNIRLMRVYSVETWEQERIVKDYWDHLAWSQN